MPRTWKRTSNRGEWTDEKLQQAIMFINEGHSIREASKHFKIPFTTLRDRKFKGISGGPLLGRKAVFTQEQEAALVERIKLMDNIFYGLTPLQVRRVAFTYAEANNVQNNFSKISGLAGKDWLNGFLKRNPLSVRKPEGVSINRLTAFNRQEIKIFFDNLEAVMTKFAFTPDRIFNMDETGVTTVQDPGKVVSTRGKKRVGSVVSWERGKIITVICCINAAGGYIPPMFIFPRKRMSPHLQKDGPPCALYSCSHNGWSNEDLFVTWLKHFIHHSKASVENKVLLVLDNHGSHATLQSYDLCRDNGIIMLSIPPHTSHRLQPLDVSFYSPLKSVFRRECDTKIKSTCLQKITPYDVAGLFNIAYSKVATIGNAVSGFKQTGIFPMNPDIFTDEDYLPAETILQHDNTPEIAIENDDPTTASHSSKAKSNDSEAHSAFCSVSSPSTSGSSSHLPTETLPKESLDTSSQSEPESDTNFEKLIPIPSSNGQNKSNNVTGKRKQHSEILTGSPQKEKLERKLLNKKSRKERSSKEKKLKNPIKKTKTKKRYRNAKRDSDTEDSDTNINEDELCDDDDLDDLPGNEDEDLCFVCGEFGQNGEEWYRCTGCGIWNHALCSGADSPVNYLCDICLKK